MSSVRLVSAKNKYCVRVIRWIREYQDIDVIADDPEQAAYLAVKDAYDNLVGFEVDEIFPPLVEGYGDNDQAT